MSFLIGLGIGIYLGTLFFSVAVLIAINGKEMLERRKAKVNISLWDRARG